MPLATRLSTFLADPRVRPWLPIAAALAIRVACVWISHGTPVVDVHSFLVWAERFDEGTNPYAVENLLVNYPPLWIFVCWLCLRVSGVTGMSFDLVIKVFISAADAATVWPIRAAARAGGATGDEATRAAWFYALNPVPILIASFHGQNDPVVIGLIMWAAWLVLATPVRFAHELALLLAGISLTIKPIAMLFLPILLFQMPTWRRRVLGLAIAMLPSVVVWLPYLVSGYGHVVHALTSYGNVPDFGYIGIFNSWCNFGHGSAGDPIVKAEQVTFGFRAAWLSLLAIAWWRRRSAGLIDQLVWLLLCLYLVYGLLAAQYLVWLVPFATAARSPQLKRVTVWTALTLLAFYEAHHPDILTGGGFWRLPLLVPINRSQWNGVFLVSHLFLYGNWLRWFWKLAAPANFWRMVWNWFVDEIKRLSKGAWNWVRALVRRLAGRGRE